MLDFLKLLAGAAVIGAFVGGVFRVYASKRAQARAEARQSIDSIRELLDKVQDLARQYYMCAGHDDQCTALGMQIRNLLQQIGSRATAFNIRTRARDKILLSHVFRFRQAVSLDLDSKLRGACSIDDNRFADIQSKADVLLMDLERRFNDLYD